MIKEKVALITGSSKGIGKGIAVEMAKNGYAVVVNSRQPKTAVQEVMDEIGAFGNPTLYLQGDIALPQDRQTMVERIMNEFGRIDLLVNNAGVGPKVRSDLLEVTEESMNFVLGINVYGTFFLTQAVAKTMIENKRKYPEFAPIIINISSISAYTSSTSRGEYCISKAAVSMMTKLFADRLADEAILVYEIRPGIIETDMTSKVHDKYDKLFENGLTPIRRWGQPADIARAVITLCSGGLSYSTGDVINVDGGFHIRRL
jgi:3-oxoacyl-[acyl-carrier protein] reductase